MQISEKQLRAAVLAYHGDDFFDCFEEGSEFANEKVEAIRAAIEAALSAAGAATETKIDEAARYLRETLQSGKNLKPWAVTDKGTKRKWLKLAQGTIEAALSAQVQDVAVEDVLSERKRQVEREGWTPEHDDAYTEYELAWAAITYAMAACADSAERAVMDQFGDHSATPGRINENWPWDWKWWKPKDRRRDLVRAAALIIAEIERLDRAAAPAKQEGGTNE